MGNDLDSVEKSSGRGIKKAPIRKLRIGTNGMVHKGAREYIFRQLGEDSLTQAHGIYFNMRKIFSVYNAKPLAKLLHTPYFPVPPHLPLLGLWAYVPLPTKFHVYFGEPMYFEGPFDDEDEIIDEKVEQVRTRIQSMINEGLERRTSVF